MGLGSSVDVTVSSGPERISIPNVVGQDWIAAAQKLRAAGLTVNQTVTQIQSYRPENEVLRTSPQAGSLVPPGTLVTLTTSQGPPPPQPANESSSNSNSNSSNSSSESSSNSNSNSSNSSSESKSTSKSKEDD
jgi:eukaryotic-like serine/threonine-protein kinase